VAFAHRFLLPLATYPQIKPLNSDHRVAICWHGNWNSLTCGPAMLQWIQEGMRAAKCL